MKAITGSRTSASSDEQGPVRIHYATQARSSYAATREQAMLAYAGDGVGQDRKAGGGAGVREVGPKVQKFIKEIRKARVVGRPGRAMMLLDRTKNGDDIHAAFEALLITHPREQWISILALAVGSYRRSVADRAEAVRIAARYLAPQPLDGEDTYALRLVHLAWKNSDRTVDLVSTSASMFAGPPMKPERLYDLLGVLLDMHPTNVYSENGTGLEMLLEGLGEQAAFVPELAAKVLDRESDIPLPARITWLVRGLSPASISEAAPRLVSLHAALLQRHAAHAAAPEGKTDGKEDKKETGKGKRARPLELQHLLAFHDALDARAGVRELQAGTVPAAPPQADTSAEAVAARSARMRLAGRLGGLPVVLVQLQAQVSEMPEREAVVRKQLADRLRATLALLHGFVDSSRVAESTSTSEPG